MDLVKAIEVITDNISKRMSLKSDERFICHLCGCLRVPADPSCPGCADKLLKRSK